MPFKGSFDVTLNGGVPLIHPLAWTPGLDQGGDVAVTVIYGRVSILGGLVVANFLADVTGTGVIGEVIFVTNTPYSNVGSHFTPCGAGVINDLTYGQWVPTGTTNARLAGTPHNLIPGDTVAGQLIYLTTTPDDELGAPS